MIAHVVFTTNVLALVFLLLGASYFYKQRRFEDKDLHHVTKLFSVSITFLAVSVLLNLVQGLQTYFDIDYIFENLGIKTIYLVYVSELIVLPLAGISILVSMIILKKNT